jgi:hypothetical protein
LYPHGKSSGSAAIEAASSSELTYAEVRAQLNQPQGTIKSHIRSALSVSEHSCSDTSYVGDDSRQALLQPLSTRSQRNGAIMNARPGLLSKKVEDNTLDEQHAGIPTLDFPVTDNDACEELGQAPVAESASEARQRRIARAAYLRAQARGFAPGEELQDWLQAERECDAESTRA